MQITRCTASHLTDCEISTDQWNLYTKWKQTEDWLADETFRERWKSFDCLLFNPNDHLVYAGLTALDGDFFYAFDPRSGTFESLHFPTNGDRYAHKIHAGLTLDQQGCIWGATATLSDVDAWPEARGGEIFSFDPRNKTYTSLGIPLPHDYIQGIVVDEKRGVLYGNTFPGRLLFRFDLATRAMRPITSYGGTLSEKILLDAQGCVWHNYHLAQWANRTPLFRYWPGIDMVEFLNLDLPNALGTGTTMIDSCLVTRDSAAFIGGSDGSLSRLDPAQPAIQYLGKPLASARMKGLLEGPHGLIYGAVGTHYDTHLFSYDRLTGEFALLGAVEDSRDGTRSWLTHDLCMVDAHTLVAAETDNPQRAACLFVVTLED